MKPYINKDNRGTYWIEFNGNVIRGGMYSMQEAQNYLSSYLAVYEQAFLDGKLEAVNDCVKQLKESANKIYGKTS